MNRRTILERLRRGAARFRMKLRSARKRFRQAGGFPALLKRVKLDLSHGEPAAIAVCASALIIVIAIPVIAIAAAGKRTGTLPEAAPKAEPAAYIDLASALPSPTPTSTPLPSPTPIPTPTPILFVKGTKDAKISEIQLRLMELGYMDYDEPTEYYGPITKEAVETFQRRHGLAIDGRIGEATYNALMREDALTYMVTVGDAGTDVEELQKRLVELDYMKDATGYFGTDTAAAVKEFQSRNDLDVDGMIGVNTREMLYSEDAVAKSLSYGEKSDDVLKYQKRLYSLGYLTTAPDGTFGKDTVAATKLFQELNGLIADGHIGPETKRILTSSDAQANALTLGMSGDTVKNVQKKLKSLKYLDEADGYFGSVTEAAVVAFQKRNNLTADGKVGRKTMALLVSGDAKAASSDYVPATPGPSSTKPPSSGGQQTNLPSSATADSLISVALSKLGCRYVTGGKGPEKFDCSGFVYWCLNQVGVKQGYMTSKTWRSVDKYQRISSMSDVRKGDILVFKMSSSKGHVGIALSSTEMVDASSGEGHVVRRSYTSPYWKDVFYCAYRIF